MSSETMPKIPTPAQDALESARAKHMRETLGSLQQEALDRYLARNKADLVALNAQRAAAKSGYREASTLKSSAPKYEFARALAEEDVEDTDFVRSLREMENAASTERRVLDKIRERGTTEETLEASRKGIQERLNTGTRYLNFEDIVDYAIYAHQQWHITSLWGIVRDHAVKDQVEPVQALRDVRDHVQEQILNDVRFSVSKSTSQTTNLFKEATTAARAKWLDDLRWILFD